MSLRFFTFDERPDLEQRKRPLLDAWPPFMFEDPVAGQRWHLLYERFGGFQHFLLDEESDELVAEVNSLPVQVDLADLPDRGWDDVMERGTDADEPPNAVTALQVMILPGRQGQGLSKLCLERMRANVVGTRIRPSRRAGAAELEGALPARLRSSATSAGRPRTGCPSTRGFACM